VARSLFVQPCLPSFINVPPCVLIITIEVFKLQKPTFMSNPLKVQRNSKLAAHEASRVKPSFSPASSTGLISAVRLLYDFDRPVTGSRSQL
jgi:hypothetical protein